MCCSGVAAHMVAASHSCLPTLPNACSQGLPVFYAPGEAEAVCAALSRAGCVDGCGSNDSDCLLYGAEAVYHTLKLSVSVERGQIVVFATGARFCDGLLYGAVAVHCTLKLSVSVDTLQRLRGAQASQMACCMGSGCVPRPATAGKGLFAVARLPQRNRT